MKEIVDRFLLVGNKFMSEMNLEQPGFTYSACGPFTINKERTKKFMQAGNADCIYRNDLDKTCFQHNMAYGESKDLAKRTQSDKVLRDKAVKIASDPKHDGYQRELASVVYKFFDNKSSGSGIATKPNYQLANELHSRSSENLRNEKYIHLLETKFGV